MHQQNLAGRDGVCIEREKALLRQKALCEQGWQNADGQRFESGPGHKHVTKRGKLSHGQVLHICQRRNCQHYVRLLGAEHLDRLMCGAALHLKRHIGMHLPELSQLRQQEMVQRRLRSADDQRTCFKSGQPLQLAFAVGQRFESAVHMGKKRRAFHGEPHAAGNAGKQLAGKRLLQPVDGAGYGGLGQAQQLGGVTCSLALDKHGKSLCGLPTDIVTTAGIAPLGKVSASLLVVGVGTTMNTKKLIRQWKTVIASFCCCAAGVLLIVFVGRFIIGTDAAIAGTPIFAGAP